MKVNKSCSNSISNRLFFLMAIIIFSLLCISVPLSINSYIEYRQTRHALSEIQALKALADLTNKISRERAPANNLMSGTTGTRQTHHQALNAYRKVVDIQLNATIELLNINGSQTLARQLQYRLKPALAKARLTVDDYAAEKADQKTAVQFDHAIVKMFGVWDISRDILGQLITNSASKNNPVTDYATLILILSDLRDQAGRVASNIIAPLAFNQKIPQDNQSRSLQTQIQAFYLWNLIDILQPIQAKNADYYYLHQQVRNEFLNEGIPMVRALIEQSNQNQKYGLTATELTQSISGKFKTVIALQDYILDYSTLMAEQQRDTVQRRFFFTLMASVVSLLAAVLTMQYIQRKIFSPLIDARQRILELTDTPEEDLATASSAGHSEFFSLFEAIGKLERILKQRDALEFQLRNIANTDSLTGVSNRLALDNYLSLLNEHPQKFFQLCLIIMDIDNFKQVNDQHGHIMGDLAIQAVAEQLKSNIRVSDLIVRYGGDEFLVLIENIDYASAFEIADKVRKKIGQHPILLPETQQQIHVSVSIGFAIGALSWLELLGNADQALLRVKAKGKNGVQGY